MVCGVMQSRDRRKSLYLIVVCFIILQLLPMYNCDSWLSYWVLNKTPKLGSAVSFGDDASVVRTLQEDGEDPNTLIPWECLGRKYENIPVLTVAADGGYANIVTALLEANANTELRGDFHLAPLSAAIVQGHKDIVKLLLTHGADINSRSSISGGLPIHYAAIYGRVTIAKMLRDHGTPLDIVDNNGRTPLHHAVAAKWGYKPMTEWLVQHGANIGAVDEDGKTAADTAESVDRKELAVLLLFCKQDPEASGTQLKILEYITATRVFLLIAFTFIICVSLWETMISAMPWLWLTVKQIRGYNKKIFILNYIDFPSSITVRYGETSVKTYEIHKRGSASTDSQNLCMTFQRLGYDVNLHENKTASQTNAILDYIQQHDSLDFILLVILSHGLNKFNEDVFITSDGLLLSLKGIQQRFTDTECPHLKGKSKIILANFCYSPNMEENEKDVACLPEVSIKEPVHNMITIFSSHEELESTTGKGTTFVHTLCEVLKRKPNMTIQQIFNSIHYEGKTTEIKVSPPFEEFIF